MTKRMQPESRLSNLSIMLLIALCGSVLLLIAALFCRLVPPTIDWQIAPTAITQETGNAYSLTGIAPPGFSLFFGFSGDEVSSGKVVTPNSRISVLEDGWPLGPGHASSAEIEELGGGRFVHTNQMLLFSSSDNSDPRSNGRTYSISHELSIRFRTILALGILTLVLVLANLKHLRTLADCARSTFQAGPEKTVPHEDQPDTPQASAAAPFGWKQLGIVAVITVVLLEGLSAIVLHLGNTLPQVSGSPHVVSPYRAYELNTPPDYSGGDHSVDGFRREVRIARPKPDRTFRIFALGGSAMYGIGAHAPYEPQPALKVSETVSSALQRKLNMKARSAGLDITFEVINAALIGYQTFQHFVYINETLAHLEPDFFVFLDGNNDFYLGKHDYNPWTEYPYSYQPIIDRLNQGNVLYGVYLMTKALPDISFTIELLSRVLHRNFIQTAQAGAGQASDPDERNFTVEEVARNYEDYAERTYLTAYRQIKVVADQLGAGMMVFRQPQVIFEDTNALSDNDKKIQALTFEFMGDQAAPMQAMGPLVPREMARLSIDFADLGTIATPATDERQLYIDYCHLTPFGATQVADKMFDHLWPKLGY